MSRQALINMAKHNMEHARNGTVAQADSVLEVPSSHYYDEAHWQAEMQQIFRRIPLMMALTCEIPNPGDYRACEAGGVPIIVCRDKNGEVQAYLNICAHRGAQIMETGNGNTHRFTCPYHAWSYNDQGELIGIFSEKEFGQIDKSCYGLKKLPVLERAGLIWVTPNPDSDLSIENFLSGYDDMLAHFNFADWHLFSRRSVPGPNWKIAYDGYLDLYHLPILHKNSFGSNFPHKSMYYAWGPHQRVASPDPSLLEYEEKNESEWPTPHLLSGVWTIFPHISIAGFDGGGRGVMLSQLFPGATPGESITVQNYMMESEPTEEQAEQATEQFAFLEHVVRNEDYATGLKQQKALETGFKDHVLFGRNEEGGQRFHGWLDTLLETPDDKLNELFANAEGPEFSQ
ncbi:MAG: aromatic ring-hydroxylating dioxygenase subunit alpha [Pseudomonadota bacterium]